VSDSAPPTPAWLSTAAKWLTPRRLHAQAVLLALCVWGVCVVDFSTPGFFDRAGNLKFQDFLPLYVSAHLIATARSGELYDQGIVASEIRPIVGAPTGARLPNLYGPQVALAFTPLAHFSFPVAARIWVTFSLLLYCTCIWRILRSCPFLRPHWGLVAITAAAFPPLFHFFVRGQLSVLVLACFTAAFLAFRSNHPVLAGFALGLLVFKPQFIVAIPLVLLLARAWKSFLGLILVAAAQLGFTWLYFGSAVMRSYFDTLWHISRWVGAAELSLAPIQMHSLRSFWTLLIPWPEVALTLYLVSSIAVIAIAAAVWRSTSLIALRFSALTLAAALVNPHLFVYDLLVLAPALLLIVDWTLRNSNFASSNALCLLVYLAFVLPLFGPLSRWTHLQLSVPAFFALLWILWHSSSTTAAKEC
jgi:hypothetical protein